MDPKLKWTRPAVLISFSEEELNRKMSNKPLLAHGMTFPSDWPSDFGSDFGSDFPSNFTSDWPSDFPSDWSLDF